LSKEDLEPLFYQSLRSLNAYGVAHDDVKLDNYILVTDNGRDKIVVIDLESAYYERTEEDLLYTASSNTNHLMSQYERHLKYLKHHGILFPSRLVRL
jgi:tRNA A-37 threonylcarbamoyl transferase component Bud32